MSDWQAVYAQRRKVFAERKIRLAAALAHRVPGAAHPCEIDGSDAAGPEMLIVFQELHWLCWTPHAVVPCRGERVVSDAVPHTSRHMESESLHPLVAGALASAREAGLEPDGLFLAEERELLKGVVSPVEVVERLRLRVADAAAIAGLNFAEEFRREGRGGAEVDVTGSWSAMALTVNGGSSLTRRRDTSRRCRWAPIGSPRDVDEEGSMDRYTSPAMAALWSDAAKYARWREVELSVLAARAQLAEDVADPDAPVRRRVYMDAESTIGPDPRDVREAEVTTRHDVVAFLAAWTETMAPETAAHVHHGLTSSDVVDTANAMVLREVCDLLDRKATRLLRALAAHARKHQATLRLARTHGQPAGPDTWGHRVADLGFAIARTRDRLRGSATAVATVKISGPVGSYTGVSRAVEHAVADRLRLGIPHSATQVLARDALAAWGADCAAVVAVCESIATEVRLGASYEVSELHELATADEVGSSSVPAKRNPIRSEKVTGLARVLRGSVGPLLEDVALWQHRDISQSSVERIELPLISALTEHALDTTIAIIEGLVVNEARMEANLRAASARAAGPAVLDYLTRNGVARLEAIRAVEAAITAADTAYDTAAANGQDGDRRVDEAFHRIIGQRTGIRLPFPDTLAYAVALVLNNADLADLYDRLDEVARS